MTVARLHPEHPMTSHLIESFAKRTNELGGIGNNSAEEPEIARKISRLNRPDDCAFCNVIAGKQPAFRIYEDDHTIAILGKFRVVAFASSLTALIQPMLGVLPLINSF